MGRRENDRNGSLDDQISMNSVGFSHGQVDFFAPQKKTQALLHRKLKVLQTWTFIQALIILLLTGYLILLTVWLNPFFPMNYSGSSTSNNNNAVIAAEVSHLKTEVMNVTEMSSNVTAEVEELEAWIEERERELGQMQSTLTRHTAEIEELQNDTVRINSTVSEFLKKSKGSLKRFQENAEANTKTKMKELQDQISAENQLREERMRELKKELEVAISVVANTTKTDLTSMSKRISDTASTADSILARMDHFGTKNAVDILNTNHDNMNISLDSIREEQQKEKAKLDGLLMTLESFKTQTTDQIQSANNNIAVGLSAVQQKQREIMGDLKRKLAQERQLSQGEVKQLRSHADAEIGRHKCRLDNLTATVGTNYDDLVTQISDSANILTQLIIKGDNKVETKINTTFEDAEDKFRTALDLTKNALDTRIGGVTSMLDSYKTTVDESITELFTREDEMWKAVNATRKNVKETGKRMDGKFIEAFGKIWDLLQGQWGNNKSISELHVTTQLHNESILHGKSWCVNKTRNLQVQIDELSPRMTSLDSNFTCLRQRVINLETEGRVFNRTIRENDIDMRQLVNKNYDFHSGRFSNHQTEFDKLKSKVKENDHQLRNTTERLHTFEQNVEKDSYDVTNPLSLKFLIFELEKKQNNCQCFGPGDGNLTFPILPEEEEEE